MSELNGVIWDLDGVLVDTGEFHYISWHETLSHYGIPFTWDTFAQSFGMNNEGILRLLLAEDYSDEIFHAISEEKEKNFRRAIRGRVKTLPGAVNLLAEIEAANILQAIGSSAPQANIDTIVSELGITSYFQAIVSAAEMPSKPDPEVFLTAAQLLNTPPERCVVFEDAIAGVEAAHRAGMKCVAITTTNESQQLQVADLIIDHLDSISVEHLKKLFD